MKRRWLIPLVLLLAAALWLWPRAGSWRQTLLAAPPAVTAARARLEAALTSAAPSKQQGNVIFRVTTAQGQPLPDVSVRIWSRGRYDPPEARYRWSRLPTPKTGAGGLARTSLAPGNYYAVAEVPGRAPARKSFVCLADEAVDVWLLLQPPVSLRGEVQDAATREPIPLAELRLIPVELDGAEPPREEQSRAASGPDGRFNAAGLAPGAYAIEAQAAGYGRSRTAQLDVPGETVVRLRAAAFVEGRVLLPDGAPAAHARVTASTLREPSVAETDESGAFSVQTEPGSLLLSARLGELAAGITKPLSVKAGATLNAGELRLQQGGSLEVAVVDGDGAPVAGAEILVSPFGWDGTTATAQSNPEGRALARGLPEGSYDLDVLADGRARYTSRGLVVSPGQTLAHKATLRGLGAVEGVVRDGSGAPVEGAVVRGQSLDTNGPSITVRSGEGGRYRLAGLPAGAAHVSALPAEENALGETKHVGVPESGTAQLDLKLDASATVSGRVLGVEPGRRALVCARSEQSLHSTLERTYATLDAEGRYSVQLPPGRWWLLPFYAGQGGERIQDGKSIEVTAGQKLQLELAFEDGDGTVSGQVLEPGGAPASRATLTLRHQDRLFDTLWADDDGRFRVTRARKLPEGTRILARKSGRSAEVPLGQGDLVIQLKAAASIRGSVTSGTQPVERFTLTVGSVPAAGRPPITYQLGGSRFALDDIPTGLVHLICTLPDGSSAAQDVTLEESEDRELAFDVTVAARVHGRVVGRDHGAVAGAAVRTFPDGEGTGVNTTTDNLGRFSTPLPKRGLVFLVAEALKQKVARHFQADQADIDLGDLVLEDDATQ